jgi:hypothetical protein
MQLFSILTALFVATAVAAPGKAAPRNIIHTGPRYLLGDNPDDCSFCSGGGFGYGWVAAYTGENLTGNCACVEAGYSGCFNLESINL